MVYIISKNHKMTYLNASYPMTTLKPQKAQIKQVPC